MYKIVYSARVIECFRLIGGAIITEAVFDWPGMGRLWAITVLDLPVIIGATYVLTVFFLVSVFIADLLYGYFDPRVRRS